MPKLEWDKTGQRFFETGVDHGVLYPQDKDGTYPEGVVWNGLTAVTAQPGGAEPNDMWADNIKYGSIRSTETYSATIEAYTYPDEFAACDGSAEVVPGVYIGQQSRKSFGFSYRTMIGNDTATEDDDGYTIHLVYNLTASPSEKNYQTINDSPEGITLSWEVQSTPVNVTGYKPTSTMDFNSLTTDPAKLKALEDILYGTDTETARLPLPDEVIQLMKTDVEP